MLTKQSRGAMPDHGPTLLKRTMKPVGTRLGRRLTRLANRVVRPPLWHTEPLGKVGHQVTQTYNPVLLRQATGVSPGDESPQVGAGAVETVIQGMSQTFLSTADADGITEGHRHHTTEVGRVVG